MNEHYIAVLADLRERKAKLEAEIYEVEAGMTAIQRLMGSASAPSAPPANTTGGQATLLQPHTDAHARFSSISVRWAVLWHLYEGGQTFQKTGEIASAILGGGYRTAAERFPNMVSAVLSSMKGKGEVESNEDGGGYRLTEAGRKTWDMIRHGHKFRAAMGETSLLGIQ